MEGIAVQVLLRVGPIILLMRMKQLLDECERRPERCRGPLQQSPIDPVLLQQSAACGQPQQGLRVERYAPVDGITLDTLARLGAIEMANLQRQCGKGLG